MGSCDRHSYLPHRKRITTIHEISTVQIIVSTNVSLEPIYIQLLRSRCHIAPKSNLLFWCCTVALSVCDCDCDCCWGITL